MAFSRSATVVTSGSLSVAGSSMAGSGVARAFLAVPLRPDAAVDLEDERRDPGF